LGVTKRLLPRGANKVLLFRGDNDERLGSHNNEDEEEEEEEGDDDDGCSSPDRREGKAKDDKSSSLSVS